MTTVMPEQDVAAPDLMDQVAPYDETDDGKDHLTHIVNPDMNRDHGWWDPRHTAQDIVNIARVFGEEIVALCGYKFVPIRNPEKYDVCQACIEIAGRIMSEEGE